MSQRILVIEDNEEMRQNIEDILGLAGYTVMGAADGKAGVALALEHKPDLILCDIMMPGLDGYGVLHILSKNPEATHIPFIFLTAKAEKEDFRTGMNLGADDYLSKPFEGLDLLRVVEIRLKKSERVLTKPLQVFSQKAPCVFQQLIQLKGFKMLLEKATERHINKKQFVYMEGEAAHDLYFVRQGKLKTYKTSEDGKEYITGLPSEGELFGYAAVLSNTSYGDSAMALSDEVSVQAIDKESLYRAINKDQELSVCFLNMLAQLLNKSQTSRLQLAYHSVRQRVAEALLHLYQKQGRRPEAAMLLTTSRRDIASLVGTATETLNRTLLDFKEEHLIDIHDGGIELLAIDKLASLFH